jgi:protein-S-isoprenylcysteine O-methyltransferase Ste14
MPRWLGGVVHALFQPVVLVALPWVLSRSAKRHGWVNGAPGSYNLVGLVLVCIGFGIIVWALAEHFAAAPAGWTFERTAHYPTPAYLITSGPYRLSRNPLYVADVTVWLGWAAFYVGIFLGRFVLKREERGLEARFGNAWRDYCCQTARWLGRPSDGASVQVGNGQRR